MDNRHELDFMQHRLFIPGVSVMLQNGDAALSLDQGKDSSVQVEGRRLGAQGIVFPREPSHSNTFSVLMGVHGE